jgi:hypothetical protein
VVRILCETSLWNDLGAWRAYGDNESNFSSVGNQQSAPEAALVEKLVNSIDAMLMRECYRSGVDPQGTEPPTPQSGKDALEQFFGIRDGVLTNLVPGQRTRLADNIQLVATGTAASPSYTIVDSGEGQTPADMPRTLLSLVASNKARIPFVQGKFNMGSSGALQFSSPLHNLQLIISRRDPMIASGGSSNGDWGFTVLRRLDPTGNFKSSTYLYLAPRGAIPSFAADSIPALPGPFPRAYSEPLAHGTVVKLYEYQLGKTLRTNIVFDLNYRLSVLLPGLMLPIRLVERRKSYRGHSMETTLAGLSVRLDEDRANNIEEGFPASARLTVDGQAMRVDIFAFKAKKKANYARREGIVFTIQGQAHGAIDQAFYARKRVGMSYLEDSLLLIVDCSDLEGRKREDLFMNSRDRLRDGQLKSDIEARLEELVREHPGLRSLREQRRQDELTERIGDSRPLADVLRDVIKKSPVLTKLLLTGTKLNNPFAFDPTGAASEYKGLTFPTIFRPLKRYPIERPKPCACNHRFRIDFETDAQNDYLDREVDPGNATLTLGNGQTVGDFTMNLWNGYGHLNVRLPSCDSDLIGTVLRYRLEVNDSTQVQPFVSDTHVLVAPPDTAAPSGSEAGTRRPPRGKDGKDQQGQSGLSLPQVREVHRDDWDTHGMTKESALRVKFAPETGYDFFVNMDNVHLLSEVKARAAVEPDMLRSQYKYGVVVVALAMLQEVENEQPDPDERCVRTTHQVDGIVDLLSPFLIPMIDALGHLEMEA